jgi:DNA-binding MarR family transcriptional regulator
MKDIGKQIKQEKFQNNYEKAYINLVFTTNYFRDMYQDLFTQAGILSQHYNILRIARGKYPNSVSPGYIKEVMLDKGRDVTRLCDKLEKLKYIKRIVNSDNKRKLDIFLTDKGLNVTNEIENELKILTQKTRTLTEEEYETLSNLLDKMRG